MVFDTMIYQYEIPNYDSWFQIRNVVNFTLIMYSYCKLLKWFMDKVNIEEHGFTRACIWMKGFYGIVHCGSTELSV